MNRILKNDLIILLSIITFVVGCIDNSKNRTKNTDAGTANLMTDSRDGITVDSLLYYEGKAIFKADCNKCHVSKGGSHNYLEGVVQRLGVDYLNLYLTKQDSLISARDSNALHLKEIWGNNGNSHNFVYSETELKSIVEYLK